MPNLVLLQHLVIFALVGSAKSGSAEIGSVINGPATDGYATGGFFLNTWLLQKVVSLSSNTEITTESENMV